MEIPSLIPTQKYEVALFPNEILGARQGEGWNQIFTQLVSIPCFSNGNNTILPIPADAPSEIPRIILNSRDGRNVCHIGPNKISIFWENVNDDQSFAVPVEERVSLTSEVINAINCSIKRIGSIHAFYFITNTTDPVRSEVFQENACRELRDYNLNLTYDLTLLETSCNQVLQISNGQRNATGENVTMVMADLNTHQGNSLNWGISNVQNFLGEAESFLSEESVFNKIFPA